MRLAPISFGFALLLGLTGSPARTQDEGRPDQPTPGEAAKVLEGAKSHDDGDKGAGEAGKVLEGAKSQPQAQPGPKAAEPPKGLDYAVVKEKTGMVQFQLEGAKDWKDAAVGTKVWNGSLIQTDFDSTCLLDFEGISVVKVEELTQVAIEKFIKDRSAAKAAMFLEVRLGDMNLDVNAGSFTADVQVRAGNVTASVRGTGWSFKRSSTGAAVSVARGRVAVTNAIGRQVQVAQAQTTTQAAVTPIQQLKQQVTAIFVPRGVPPVEKQSAQQQPNQSASAKPRDEQQDGTREQTQTRAAGDPVANPLPPRFPIIKVKDPLIDLP